MTARNFALAMTFAEGPTRDGQGVHVTPGDDGGATAYGITIATFTFWRVTCRRMRRPTIMDLAQITQMEVWALHRALFWNLVQGDQLPSGPDAAVFDMSRGTGPRPAVMILQEAVGVDQDGHIGPLTLAAAAAMDSGDLVRRLGQLDAQYYRTLRSDAEFDAGWQRLNIERTAFCLTLV